MNKKALFIGAIFLTVAITIIIPAAATAGPKEEAEPAQVTLIGITTSLGRTQALLRVKWPAGVSNREASYILSEGQSQDGLTLDSLGVTNAIVTLKEGQVRRTIRLEPSRNSQYHQATLGQQLLDLKSAQANNVITETQYQSLKAKLISHRNVLRSQKSVDQQLLDLQVAKTNMAITEAEYQTLKTDLLSTK